MIRNNDFHDSTENVEPQLLPVTSEIFNNRIADWKNPTGIL